MSTEAGGPRARLIGAETAETYTILAGRADAGLVIVCDHAGRALPDRYGRLGLPDAEFDRHIAYDIGAAGVVGGLARQLGVPAVLSHYSRLLIDLNRGLDDPTLIMRISDGSVIPGNRLLDDAERAFRIREFYEPYHGAISRVLDGCEAAGRRPALLSIHSFTPVWKGVARPWHAAVLWDQDRRLAGPLIDELRRDPRLVVGDNEPYSGRLKGDTMWRHGTSRDLPHALIEIRQDLIGDEGGQAAWAARLAGIVPATLPSFRAAEAGVDLPTARHDIQNNGRRDQPAAGNDSSARSLP